MKILDGLAQKKYGIPSIVLMENAGRVAAEEIFRRFKSGRGAVFCGKGNNGGDGFVCARYLRQKNFSCDVFITAKAAEIKNKDPIANLATLKRSGMKIAEAHGEKEIARIKNLSRYDFIVDAIFGIGFRGDLPANIAHVVDLLNAAKKPIYALDVPSGLDATTGKVESTAVKAYKTITFGLPKTGFLKKEARPYVGSVVVKDIGFPRMLLK